MNGERQGTVLGITAPERGYIARAKTTEWYTPKLVLDAVRKTFKWNEGEIDLDPCWAPGSLVEARRTISPLGDGLTETWGSALSVFVNPPYGRGLGAWLERCSRESAEGREIIALIPAAVDTKNWQRLIFREAEAVCFIDGRLRFEGADASAPFASAAVLWGVRTGYFESAFDALGTVLRLGRAAR